MNDFDCRKCRYFVGGFVAGVICVHLLWAIAITIQWWLNAGAAP